MGLSRAQKHNQEILKLMGEIKDASEGLSVIESRCNVNENPRVTRLSKLASINEDISSSAKPSEIQ